MKLFDRLALVCTLLITLNGCGIIFGTSQKVDNKSNDYTAYRFEREGKSDWKKIDTGVKPSSSTEGSSVSEQEPEQADLAYENASNGGIISLNSICHPQRSATLEQLTNNLLMGLPELTKISSEKTTLDGSEALRTVVESKGKEDKPDIRITTLVTRKEGCTYDFMFIIKTSAYGNSIADFEKFIKGFHAK